jgi:dTDP-4-dehydrorhamnose 3,5-epimerase
MWNDPALGIDWPVEAREAVLSERDQAWPGLVDLDAIF